MSRSTLSLHASSAASGGLAAAIAMAITQIVCLLSIGEVQTAITWGVSLSSIAFGGTYAGVFFGRLARSRRTGRDSVAAGKPVTNT